MIPLYSQACVQAVKEFEGLVLERYFDPVGLPTIGYGHLLKPGETQVYITEAEATDLLEQDLLEAWDGVRRQVKVDLNQGQVDALTSFVFNLGEESFKRSTLRRKLNVKDYAGAEREFERWVFAAGQRLPGLVKRREMERQMFAGTLPPDVTWLAL